MSGEVIIRRQVFNITTSSEKLAFECRQLANDSISGDLIKVYERLAHLYHLYTHSDQYIILDTLKVDLGELSITEFRNRLFHLLEDKLTNELQNQFHVDDASSPTDSPNSVVYSTTTRQYQEAFLFFLQNGRFPWWYQKTGNKTPAEILADFDKENRTNLLIDLAAKRNAPSDLLNQILKRLFCHLPETACVTYLAELGELYSDGGLNANVQLLIQQHENLTEQYHISVNQLYLQAILFILLTNDTSDFLQKFLRHLNHTLPEGDIVPHWIKAGREELLPNVDQESAMGKAELPSRSRLKTSKTGSEQDEGIYISNAGLIILHPFLTLFFENLGLLDDNRQFISSHTQIKAAVILYYLQSGKDDYKEWEMSLNKILCGMATDELIPNDILLSDQEKAESDTLLKTVIEYWDALKRSSVEAVQTTFLTREGKVSFKETHWLIQVERTGVDILVDRLPWGIGTIKLPWLNELIYVEW
jgi:hypothetical protein